MVLVCYFHFMLFKTFEFIHLRNVSWTHEWKYMCGTTQFLNSYQYRNLLWRMLSDLQKTSTLQLHAYMCTLIRHSPLTNSWCRLWLLTSKNSIFIIDFNSVISNYLHLKILMLNNKNNINPKTLRQQELSAFLFIMHTCIFLIIIVF